MHGEPERGQHFPKILARSAIVLVFVAILFTSKAAAEKHRFRVPEKHFVSLTYAEAADL
jgi:uncharacterized membrane protein YsdA (DUF1294 family)